jgi:hypothetical protein
MIKISEYENEFNFTHKIEVDNDNMVCQFFDKARFQMHLIQTTYHLLRI